MPDSLQRRLAEVRERIRTAAERCGRDPAGVRLVAVSKTVPTEVIRLAAAAGVTDVGENYVQEAREKHAQLSETRLRWHFIGHLQSNKARYAVRMCDLIHTLDSLKLAVEIDRCAERAGKIQEVLIQVNVAGETSKAGVASADALPLVRAVAALEHLAVKGLMTMPPFFNDPQRVRPFFADLRRLSDRIRDAAVANVAMDELSMGMTGDFEAAIAEGATMVRVGTAIFGARA
jgi:pyridoxal phosphate enzyme (YggS family)